MNPITYYAVIGSHETIDQPLGLLRRLEHEDGPEDEGLRRDLSWKRTSLIAAWESGRSDNQLVEVSHAQASRIVRYFREKFAQDDS
jgi:hypothetical protein